MILLLLAKTVLFLATWGKWTIIGTYALAILTKYIRPEGVLSKLSWKKIHLAYLSLLLVWIIDVGVGQYLFWKSNSITLSIANSPIPEQVHLIGLSVLLIPLRHLPHSYVIYTVFMKFIAPLIWQLGVTGLVALVFGLAHENRPHLFTIEEGHLLIAACLIAGWPGVTLVVPLFFVLFLSHSIYGIARGHPRTEIGLSAAVCLFAGLVLRMKTPAILWILGT